MSLYTERDPVKLREIAVALCVETAKRSSTHTSAQLTRVAEATVPPVPTPEPEYHTHKGVTYRDGMWWDADGASYTAAFYCIAGNPTESSWQQEALTDDDHAALMALKANPVKVATPITTCILCGGSGMCASGGQIAPCGCAVIAAERAEELKRKHQRTPATVASEPECIAALRRACSASVVVLTDVWDSRIAYGTEILDAYDNHPATEAEALAVLVGAGWKEHALSQYVGFSKPDNIRVVRSPMMHVRVLIAPEGK